MADSHLNHGDVLIFQYLIIDQEMEGEDAEHRRHYLLPPIVDEYLYYLVHRNSFIQSGPFIDRALTKSQHQDIDIVSVLQEQRRKQMEKNMEALYIQVRREDIIQKVRILVEPFPTASSLSYLDKSLIILMLFPK